MPRQFKGVIDLDVRKSKPDWDAFLDTTAPKNAPDVLVILYDDTGQASWSIYGGRIEMPTLDRLAKNGLTYTEDLKDNLDLPRLGVQRLRAEHQVEFFCDVHITPWLQLTGDLQIIRPNLPDTDTAYVPGARLRVVF